MKTTIILTLSAIGVITLIALGQSGSPAPDVTNLSDDELNQKITQTCSPNQKEEGYLASHEQVLLCEGFKRLMKRVSIQSRAEVRTPASHAETLKKIN